MIHFPLATDIKQLTNYLEAQITSETEYKRLQRLVMTTLILFNKRRPTEVANLTIDKYLLAKETTEESSEFMAELPIEEQLLAKG